MVSTSVSPELEELLRKPDTRSPEEAAEADTRKVFERYGKELQAIIAEAVAGDIAAAREAGRREGMEEAIRIIDALPRSLEPDWTGTIRDMFPKYLPARVHVPTVDEGVAAIRAKLEER